MSDSPLSALDEIKQAGLRPGLRWPAIYLRRLAWPVLRAWLLHGVQQTQRLEAELARHRQQAAADRAADQAVVAMVQHELVALQAALAAFTVDRQFFETAIRTELMAMTNVVDSYRSLVEQALDGSPSTPAPQNLASPRIDAPAGPVTQA